MLNLQALPTEFLQLFLGVFHVRAIACEAELQFSEWKQLVRRKFTAAMRASHLVGLRIFLLHAFSTEVTFIIFKPALAGNILPAPVADFSGSRYRRRGGRCCGRGCRWRLECAAGRGWFHLAYAGVGRVWICPHDSPAIRTSHLCRHLTELQNRRRISTPSLNFIRNVQPLDTARFDPYGLNFLQKPTENAAGNEVNSDALTGDAPSFLFSSTGTYGCVPMHRCESALPLPRSGHTRRCRISFSDCSS